MAKRLYGKMTFDGFEDENMFTRGALKADENAADLVSRVDEWMGWIDEERRIDRDGRQTILETDADRIVSNENLDIVCVAFGDELYLATGKDRTSSRWTQFFSDVVSKFIRQPYAQQIGTVKGWLGMASDPVFDTHRPAIEKWAARADSADVRTKGSPSLRAQLKQRREDLADRLTKARDELHAELAKRARERGLSRNWPDNFFMVESRDRSTKAASSSGSSTSAPATDGMSSSEVEEATNGSSG